MAEGGSCWCFTHLFRRRPKKLGVSSNNKWPLDEWLEHHQEEAIDPEREIIDPHHHLWDVRNQPKGWPLPVPQLFNKLYFAIAKPRDICERVLKKVPPPVANTFVGKSGRQVVLVQPYMGPELLLDIRNRDCGKRGHNVVKTVYLECSWKPAKVEEALQPVGEVHMVEEVHKAFPSVCNGIVASANLLLPDVEKTLKAYSELKSVRGIRHSLAWSSDDGIMRADHAANGTARDPDFRRGFALLEKYGLSFDTWMYHEQLEDVTDLAKAFPNTTIIVDHVAQPLGILSYTREGSFPTWEKGMRELAKASENVHVKLSGLAMCNLGFCLDEGPPPTSAKLAELWGPYFRLCLEAFGVRRCMFASNFPVDKVSCDYTVMWNAFKLIVKDYSEADKAALFHDNAKCVYRL